MLNSGFAKDNINAKINTKINKWLTFDFNARLSYQKVKGTGSGADDNQSSATTSCKCTLCSILVLLKWANQWRQ